MSNDQKDRADFEEQYPCPSDSKWHEDEQRYTIYTRHQERWEIWQAARALSAARIEELEKKLAEQQAEYKKLMAIFQERDAGMQASWKSYKEREGYLLDMLAKIRIFTESSSIAPPPPESYKAMRIEDIQQWGEA
jgi:hypothetical protein